MNIHFKNGCRQHRHSALSYPVPGKADRQLIPDPGTMDLEHMLQPAALKPYAPASVNEIFGIKKDEVQD
jgi:hypothetical protein